MAERLEMIMQLGALQTELAQRGDDRAAALVQSAAGLLFSDGPAVERDTAHRAKGADRQRRKRDRDASPERDITPRHVTSRSERDTLSPGFSPTPPFPTPTPDNNTPTACEATAGRELVDAKTAAEVERLTSQVTAQCPAEAWPALDAFLRRRQFTKWHAWLKEFLSSATHAGWPVVAQVCSDDAALERPIGSPAGFRSFVATAKREGMAPPTTGAGPPRRGARPTPQTYEYPKPTPAPQADEWLK